MNKKLQAFTPRMSRITKEFMMGFAFLNGTGRSVTVFGSARVKEKSETYEEAKKLALLLAKEGFSVVTGGGPGIMEAANRGASEAGGRSIGLNIQLKTGWERANKYVTERISFRYFFVRKVMLAFASKYYVFFPGGFGTLDEFFEILTLVQTGKIRWRPLILVGESYWIPLLKWMEEELLNNGMVEKKDIAICRVVKDADAAMALIKKLNRKKLTG